MTGHLADDDIAGLEPRLGPGLASRRLALERAHEARPFGRGLNPFSLDDSRVTARAIAFTLKATGSYARGARNAAEVTLTRNIVRTQDLPKPLGGFAVLHLSDLHCDISDRAMQALAALIGTIECDICVMTGDYRGATHGPIEPALAVLAELRPLISCPVFGVLGNHDSLRMVPHLEWLGIRMLMNEAETIVHKGARLHLGGVDDPHFHCTHDVARAAVGRTEAGFSILLAHSPEICREAADAGFDLMLCGHTHGGQICLPGGIAVTLQGRMPRRCGSGPWRQGRMQGYTSRGAGTSLVPVRFNCPPEITLHRLERG